MVIIICCTKSHENHGRAYREGGFHIAGSEQNRAMQNIEGVHISLTPKLGNKTWRAYIEGVHMWRVHIWRVDCTLRMTSSVNTIARNYPN